MVAPIAVASAGLGMMAGVAMAASTSSSSSSVGSFSSSSAAPRCAACGGTGKEECRLCVRWSDGGRDSSGCGTCAGTRHAPCRSCGGHGKGRRAPVRVAARTRGRRCARWPDEPAFSTDRARPQG